MTCLTKQSIDFGNCRSDTRTDDESAPGRKECSTVTPTIFCNNYLKPGNDCNAESAALSAGCSRQESDIRETNFGMAHIHYRLTMKQQ
ncbi:MAG: hypothetical protein IPK11_15295 [Ignavibacteria bacterium]|nr:hypothetical protein [Ignavibacteria bacterium]